MRLKSLFTILFLFTAIHVAIARDLSRFEIAVTRDLENKPMPTREYYLSIYPENEFVLHSVERLRAELPYRDEEGTVALAVNHELYNALEDRFNLWSEDLAGEGYDVVLLIVEGGTAAELKETVIEEGGAELAGVIFAGELPLAWYEHREHFWNEEEPDNQRVVEYPIDMFFMDIDGVWEDTTGNGVYDHHHGEVHPDIWLGRLPAYNLSRMEEEEVVADYLDRVRRYRREEIDLPHRALNYIDDDWTTLEREWTGSLRQAYGFVSVEKDSNTTSAADYSRRLEDEEYELIQVAVHSSYDAHLFYINNRTDRDYFRFWDLRDDIDANALFYNLFACSIMNMAPREGHEHNLCLGVLYAMGEPYSLGAVGSTKTGGMLYFEDYYGPLSEGASFGESLRRWMTEHAHDPESPNWARSWFYGMTHYGDPTLKIERGVRIAGHGVDEIEGDRDGIFDAGETAAFELSLNNLSAEAFENVSVHIHNPNQQYVTLIDEGPYEIDRIPPGNSVVRDAFRVRVDESCPDGKLVGFDFQIVPEGREEWWDHIEFNVRAPKLEVVGFGWSEIDGSGDGFVEAGENGALSVQFRNTGGDDMHRNAEVEYSSKMNFLEFEEERGVLDSIVSGAAGYSQAVGFRIGEEAGDQDQALVEVNGFWGEIELGGGIILMPIKDSFQFADSLEVEPDWFRHYAVTETRRDDWRWLEEDAGGEGVIAIGGPDTLEYRANCDAAFELPLMMYNEDALLEIRHRFDVEEEYDACVVEIDNGGGWLRVEPEGGYNGISVENGEYPGGECWNGAIDWTNARIPLRNEAGGLRIRFRFSSDAGVERNGWFIDRISIDGVPLDVQQRKTSPVEFELTDVYPNPFNGSFSISFKQPEKRKAEVYLTDLTGRMAKRLYDGMPGEGIHKMSFDASELPSGIYFVNLNSRGVVVTRKIMLLK